jgi:hypothetical protein
MPSMQTHEFMSKMSYVQDEVQLSVEVEQSAGLMRAALLSAALMSAALMSAALMRAALMSAALMSHAHAVMRWS